MTRYARDEFDRVPQNSSRQGVHRAATETPRASLVPILAVGIVALVVGLVCFLILPKLGIVAPSASSSNVSTEASKESSVVPGTSTPSATPLASTGPEVTPSPTVSSTPTPSVPAVDKTAVVSVYNGTTTGGLAARVAGKVQADGWPLGVVSNWGGTPQQASVIFYNGAANKANAEAVAALLGIANLVESAAFQQPVVVVLGPGFQ